MRPKSLRMQAPGNSVIPIIDIEGLRLGTHEEKVEVARVIGEACREIGFFYVAGHGVALSLMQQAFTFSKLFFALPEATKNSVSMLRSPHNRGYVALGDEALDPGKPADLKQAYNIGLELSPDDPEVLAGRPFRGVNLWPQPGLGSGVGPSLDGFKATMLEYYDANWALGRLLHEAFSIDLGLPVDYFADKLDRPMATLRLLHYPPMPERPAIGQLGAGEHTDYGNITLLATDEVGGLEVCTRSGKWLAAPPMPEMFVCNIGDCLMRWTNDIYVSTPHRVVNRLGRERHSIAFFLDPNPETIVATLPGYVGEGPPKYPPVTASDFLRARLDPNYAHTMHQN